MQSNEAVVLFMLAAFVAFITLLFTLRRIVDVLEARESLMLFRVGSRILSCREVAAIARDTSGWKDEVEVVVTLKSGEDIAFTGDAADRIWEFFNDMSSSDRSVHGISQPKIEERKD